jgi:hypothetical protein
MPNPVTLVTVHHEGAGAPCPMTQASRFGPGGYTYGICTDGWAHFRDVWQSYATLNFNHRSLDLCLSGNRMDYEVTAADIGTISSAVADARKRGYVVDQPMVRAHRDSPGSQTVCPGDLTMERWAAVVVACQAAPAPGPSPTPPEEADMMASTVNADGRSEVFRLNGTTLEHKWIGPGNKWSAWVGLAGAPPLTDLTAWTNVDGRLEVAGTSTGGATGHMWQGSPGKDWSTWNPL